MNITLTPKVAAQLYNFVCELMTKAEGADYDCLLDLAKQLDFTITNYKD
jgi:dsDNA-binding SOS-regulon protein